MSQLRWAQMNSKGRVSRDLLHFCTLDGPFVSSRNGVSGRRQYIGIGPSDGLKVPYRCCKRFEVWK